MKQVMSVSGANRRPCSAATRLVAGGGAAVALLSLVLLSGCAVPQRPGAGRVMHLREPKTGAGYWLYLPDGYAQGGVKHPLVMTFHGMKPFDNANRQCREWQQEADRYGFVVCAPELRSPALFGPLPLDRITGSLQHDERVILTIMDDLRRTVEVEPNAVLVTCWSYGGYVAHYMVNRHPERFSCLAVKQSNFSANLLDPANVPRYRDYKVAVFYTENDFAICQRESQEAAIWYSAHGFDLTFAEFGDKGHERTPSLAAAFFARDCGAQAKTPPLELAMLRVKERPLLDRTDGHVNGVEPLVAPRPVPTSAEAPVAAAGDEFGSTGAGQTPEQRGFTQWRPIESGSSLRTRPASPTAPEARRSAPLPVQHTEPQPELPVRVRLRPTIGISPLLVSYSVVVPDDIRGKAYYLWTDNGEPISNGLNGQLFLTAPGEHRIEVSVTTEDGQEFRTGRTVTVVKRITRRQDSDQE
ncbi:MAG: prolyl oligopeptidase family serine peptidase [bacterium]|nr:prolyl oligopeptidase family serine peptidase [bacterium]